MSSGMEQAISFIKALWAEDVIVVRDAPVSLRSGRMTRIYVNFRNFALDPGHLALMTRLFGNYLESRPGPKPALGAAASLLSPFLTGALSLACSLPCLIHRPGKEEKGLEGSVFSYHQNPSASYPPRPVLLIDDVASTGATINAAALAFREAGLSVAGVFVFVDKRRASARRDPDMPYACAVNLAEVLETGLALGFAPASAAPAVKEELQYLVS